MQAPTIGPRPTSATNAMPDVRVLLVTDKMAARLTLEAVLEKSGYSVETAASSSEAMDKLEARDYALVLCDLRGEGPDACRSVMRVAAAQEYRPAVSYLRISPEEDGDVDRGDEMLVEPVDVPRLLTQITDLIADRARGRAARSARRSVA